MPHPLQDRVREISRRARTLAAAYGASGFVGWTLALCFLLGMTDFLLHFRDPGIRWLSSLAWYAAAGAGYWWFLHPLSRRSYSDLETALQIERQFPNLRSRLASSIEFLSQPTDDPVCGSPDLRSQTIREMEARLKNLDFSRCLNFRRTRNALCAAAAALLLVGGVFLLDARAASLASRRLLAPWSQAEWPRRHRLAFLQPQKRIAIGADFEVRLHDLQGELPAEVRIQYQFEKTQPPQTFVMQPLGEKMLHRLDNVRQSFRFRAEGGDDLSMEWIEVEVIEPPRLADHRVRVYAPQYTGWAPVAAGKNVTALEGSRLEIEGQANKPIASASLRLRQGESTIESPLPKRGENGFRLPASANSPWVAEQTGVYEILLKDQQGLGNVDSAKWSLRVAPDRPPQVTLEQPVESESFVSRRALIPLRGWVRDDLALSQIVLRYRRGDQPEFSEKTIVLHQGPEKAAPQPDGLAGNSGQRQPLQHDWDLAEIAGLSPGGWIEFSVAASDYKPQEGAGPVRRLTFVSEEELDSRLIRRQSQLLGTLADVLKDQQNVCSHTESLEIQLQQTGRLQQPDMDQLHSVELNQRRIGQRVSDPREGLQTQAAELLRNLENNRLDRPETARHLKRLQEVLDELARGNLPSIERQLLDSLKIARLEFSEQQLAGDSNTAKPLKEAGRLQKETIASLEKLLEEMRRWDDYRRISADVAGVHREQQQIQEAAERQRLQGVGRSLEELSPQQRADLERLAQKQAGLARRVDKLQGRMESMGEELQERDPLAAETLAEALDAVRRSALSGAMRESARDIQGNRVGRAVQKQAEIDQQIEDWLDTLANRREHQLDRRLKKLNEAEEAIKQLEKKQKALKDDIAAAQNIADPQERKRELERLRKQQQQLAEEAQKLGRRLERLQAQKAADSLQQIGDQGDDGQNRDPQEQAKLTQELLDQAQQDLQEDKQQTAKDLHQEQLVRLEQEMIGLARRQEAVGKQTGEMDALFQQQQQQWRRGQTATLDNLAAEQLELSEITSELAEKMASAPVFELGLRSAARSMSRSLKGLQRRKTDEDIRAAQKDALKRLQRMAEAIRHRPPPPSDSQPSEQQGDAAGDQPGDNLPRLAELMLLKKMQEEIHRRTVELEKQRRDQGEWSESQQQEVQDLAQEQGRLAELLLELSQE